MRVCQAKWKWKRLVGCVFFCCCAPEWRGSTKGCWDVKPLAPRVCKDIVLKLVVVKVRQ